MHEPTTKSISPWPHRFAVALVAVVFPLIWVGGLVTTHNAGMAVPDWPSTYGYNLFLYPWQTWLWGPFDLFVEHGHRLLGALAGLITIVLLVSLWRHEARRWVCWLGVVALVAVVGQGLLGGLRVTADDRVLAKIHGCTGPLYFALTVALAAVTSRWWREADPLPSGRAAIGTRTLAVGITAIAYFQLVLGAHLRHLPIGFEWPAFRLVLLFHLFTAAMLVVLSLVLVARCWRRHGEIIAVTRPAGWLAAAILAQVALGCATWVTNYGFPSWFANWRQSASYVVVSESMSQSLITTGHVALGSLVLVTGVVVSLRCRRWLPVSVPVTAKSLVAEPVESPVARASSAVSRPAPSLAPRHGSAQRPVAT